MATATNKGRKRVSFEVKATPGATVMLAGTFNDWEPSKHQLDYDSGVYRKRLMLPRGRHEYKFVIDDHWCIDPECEEWCPDGYGALNSVINVH